ncbi:MAG: 50S ribosomal protein L10, partial [Bacilli bacterium]
PDRNGMISMFLSVLNAPIQKFAATVKAVAEK